MQNHNHETPMGLGTYTYLQLYGVKMKGPSIQTTYQYQEGHESLYQFEI